ncbi:MULTISPECIES: endonuclease V [unclassified Gilliamella]|uniref:endonuclease V n=1 Tax=unclassified Gilliamella TaxID=2685620 RepID=UPI001147773B|nr:endonuclease V [Gilliamella apicola]
MRCQIKHPLYVTSIGISLESTAENVQLMAGKYRIPDLLSYLNQQIKLFKHKN